MKAHPRLVSEMNIHAHHVVFIVPLSLSQRSLRRMCERISMTSTEEARACNLKHLNHLTIHIIRGSDILFDRF